MNVDYWNKKTFYAVIFGTVMYDVRSWLILDRLWCNHSYVRVKCVRSKIYVTQSWRIW